jgi:Right handed beta helix region
MICNRFAAVAAFATLLSTASLAHAQASRTWISGVGDDANPCSRTAPCKTFAGAISKTAALGEINTLDPGGFGTVTITKSITLDATAGLGGVLASGTTGIIINAGANDVVILRNLEINGFGSGLNGIRILNARDVYVENCKIFGFATRGISDERTTGRLFVSDTVISNTAATGIGASAATPSTLAVVGERVRILRSGNAGVIVGNGAKATFANSVISGNTNHGVFVTGSGAEVNIDDSVLTSNGTGLTTAAGGVVRLSNSTVTGNSTGLSPAGGSIFSYGTNRLEGNATNGVPSGSIPLQ